MDFRIYYKNIYGESNSGLPMGRDWDKMTYCENVRRGV